MPRPAPVTASTILTARLRLRAHRLADFDASAAMWADPAVTRFLGGKPSTREESWARLLRYAGHWQWLGYGFWAVESLDDETYLGELGFADFCRDIVPAIDVPEAGWSFAAAAHGRGFATEGLRAALAWGDTNLRAPATACIVDLGNDASVSLAERCGFTAAGRVTYKGDTLLKFERRTP